MCLWKSINKDYTYLGTQKRGSFTASFSFQAGLFESFEAEAALHDL